MSAGGEENLRAMTSGGGSAVLAPHVNARREGSSDPPLRSSSEVDSRAQLPSSGRC